MQNITRGFFFFRHFSIEEKSSLLAVRSLLQEQFQLYQKDKALLLRCAQNFGAHNLSLLNFYQDEIPIQNELDLLLFKPLWKQGKLNPIRKNMLDLYFELLEF